MSAIERAVRRLKSDEATEAPRATEVLLERAVRRMKSGEVEEGPRTPDVLLEPGLQVPPPGRPQSVEDGPKRPKSLARRLRSEGPSDTIDLAKLASAGMIVPGGTRSQTSEEFRVIKRPLLKYATGYDPSAARSSNLILVTSSLPNEGKTFTSINLALSISLELDHSVLLVDADVAQPRGGSFLGLKPRKGLMDLLIDPELPLEEAVIRTNVDRLDVLLSGRPNTQATELLASDVMSRRLGEIAAQRPNRIVILDAPPLMVTTEASALAQRVGQVVMVVEAGKTPLTTLKAALAQLEGCNVRGLLNKGTSSLAKETINYSRYRYSE